MAKFADRIPALRMTSLADFDSEETPNPDFDILEQFPTLGVIETVQLILATY